jgi:hypothetical protein
VLAVSVTDDIEKVSLLDFSSKPFGVNIFIDNFDNDDMGVSEDHPTALFPPVLLVFMR